MYGYIYDKIYSFKNYAQESAALKELILQHNPKAQTLLDVACGTGKHLEHLKQDFSCSGLDLDAAQLGQARSRNPEVGFFQGDMTAFALGQRFDAITCLFSAIGFVNGVSALNQTLVTFAAHLNPGGVVIVEPWLSPEVWQNQRPHATFVDEPDLKIARLNTSRQQGMHSVLDFHYLVATPQGVELFREELKLYLFSAQQYLEAFAQAGLSARYDPQGLTERGLYIATQPR